ncbi:ABC transporter permease [Corallococcus llansteffanensis]|uniref:ABC transporter permease n=1 Tax=Corallococcus llansteffanensis TaxID=2316731 RepID=A0A3A8P2T6_9BACT|nr:ABC transporter permease [Corallococcus llansteffanensis]RKH50876.1 ABC transporter permease [Corallococcus llansteffanensis]
MDSFLQDMRYAVRGLLRDRGFTFVAILTLALGIGANTVIFSFLDALMLRPFDFPALDRLVFVVESTPGYARNQLSAAVVDELHREARALERVSAFQSWDLNLTGNTEPERLLGYRVTPDFFGVLGVGPALGRALQPDEGRAERERVVVLSHALWERRFGADPAMVGRSVTLDGEPYTVVGVMPPDFRFPKAAQLWVPLELPARAEAMWSEHAYQAVGRLKEGLSLQSLRSQLALLEPRMALEDPGHRVSALPLREYGDAPIRLMLWVLMAATVLVLGVACANVGGMQLARAARRSQEMAIRGALGASQGRLARQLLTESLLLALLGAMGGLLLAVWGINLMRAGVPADVGRFVPGWNRVGLDARVLGFTLVVAVSATLAFGLAPALRASRVQPADVMRREGRGGGTGRQRLRQMLVASQLAFALVLTVCAALNARSFASMMDAPAGFERERLLTLKFGMSERRYPDNASVVRFLDEALARLGTLPGVRGVAGTSSLPLGPSWSRGTLEVEGEALAAPGNARYVFYQVVTEDYFRVMSIPLREGAGFTAQDGADAPLTVLISHSLARSRFPEGGAVGRRIALASVDGKPVWRTVKGVVADVQVATFGSGAGDFAAVYLPQRQETTRDVYLALRTMGEPLGLAPSVRRLIAELDPELPLTSVKPMRQVVDETLLAPRYAVVLLLIFAGVALILSAVGVYGVIAYGVTQRTHEIGVRMALGARSADVVWMVMRQGLRPTLIGVALGLLGAVAAARGMSGLLYGVRPFEPLIFTTMALFLIVVAVLATLIPMRHALRVDPIVALRAE